jgi:hypothetical protein
VAAWSRTIAPSGPGAWGRDRHRPRVPIVIDGVIANAALLIATAADPHGVGAAR